MTAPVLDRAAKRFLAALNRAAAPNEGPSVTSLRAAATELAKMAGEPPAVERSASALAANGRTIPLRIYAPLGAAAASLPGLVYLHGGGLVSGDLETHDAIVAALAAGAGCRIIAVDYARAPEHKFPAAFDDAFAVVSAVTKSPGRFALERVGVGGDSAGGQLAALCAIAARDASVSLDFQFLLCPVIDCLGRTPSREAMSNGYLLDEATMRVYWQAYRVGGLDDRDPRVAPLEAKTLRRLAPAFIHVAEGDPLRDEGVEYAEALLNAGVATRLTRHAGLIHHFYGLGAVIPAARPALAAIVEDLRRACFAAAL